MTGYERWTTEELIDELKYWAGTKVAQDIINELAKR